MRQLATQLLAWALIASAARAQEAGVESSLGSEALVPADPSGQGVVQTTASPEVSTAEAAREPAADKAAPMAETSPSAAAELEAAAFPLGAGDEASPDSAPMTAAELEALGISTKHSGIDTSLQFSGFADFSLATQITRKSSLWRAGPSAPTHSSFFIGNFNLYIQKNLTESLRTMGEVRFSYLPNGVVDAVSRTRTTTSVPDYNDYGRPTKWAAVEIERIYLEWTPHPLLSVRGGQFLTPYGIWNVDHGSPTYIPVQRPFVVGLDWFPERQTGLELLGRWDASRDHAVGYHLTLSNGTGPVSEYLDLDENKAIGGRTYWEYRGLGVLRIGASAYYGRHTDAIAGYFVEGTTAKTRETVLEQYDSLAFAADISWKYRGWHIQSEWITHQRAYTEKGRVIKSEFGQPVIPADAESWGMYALLGYRFSWLGVMPFTVVEHIDSQDRLGGINNLTLQGGLNIRPVESLALKLVYYHVQFFEGAVSDDDPLRLVQAQAAWAF